MADSKNDTEKVAEAVQTPDGVAHKIADPRAAAGARTLEDILWSAATRFGDETHAFIDRESFAEQIFGTWEGEMPSEAFINRFFDGEPGVDQPRDMAEAIVRAARGRMNAYEFDLNTLEYVVIEGKDDFIIVSDAGEFALPNVSTISSSILDAVVPDTEGIVGSADKLDRSHEGQPRAYLVKRNGDIVAVDVLKLSAAIKSAQPQLTAAAELPQVDRPGARLQPFNPRKRALSEWDEVKLLRRDRRVTAWDDQLPSRRPLGGLAGGTAAAMAATPPQGADPTVLLLLPDGTLARPVIGAASRWQEMISAWAERAAIVSLGASSAPEAVLGGQTFMVQSDRVVAVFTNGASAATVRARSASGDGFPGSVGRSAELQAGAISSVRLLQGNVRDLSEDALAEAIASGARVVGGMSAPINVQGTLGNAFWIQPEVFFAPTAREQANAALDMAQNRGVGRLGESTTRQLVADGYGYTPSQSPELVGQPMQLGQVTGDPWADWALATGGQLSPAEQALPAFASRRGGGTPIDATAAEALGLPSQRALREGQITLFGEKIVAFRGADGALVVQPTGMVRMAQAGRAVGVLNAASESSYSSASGAPIGSRSGALPATALQALANALERTAAAGGYKLPPVRILSADNAIGVGETLSQQLDGASPLRRSARLAGTTEFGAGGQVARMVLSMPFPSAGEVVVGSDLSEALQSLLASPVSPSGQAGQGGAAEGFGGGSGVGSGVWLSGGALGGAALGGLAGALALRGGGGGGAPVLGPDGQLYFRGGSGAGKLSGGPGGDLVIDLGSLHQQAAGQAEGAATTLELPEVAQTLTSRASLMRLPLLLRRALAESGQWSPATGAPLPMGVQQLVLASPFDLPELVASEGASPMSANPPQYRGVNPGEEEIVIPMPLWAQMGRGTRSETQDILQSSRMPLGFEPPLGYYRLVAPSPVDLTGGAPAGTPGVATLSGPTRLNIEITPGGTSAVARKKGGEHILGRVAIDDGETTLSARGRMRVGAPLDAATLAAVAARRQQAVRASDDSGGQSPARSDSDGSIGSGGSSSWTPSSAGSSGSGSPGGSFGTDAGFSSSSSGVPGLPKVPSIDLPDTSALIGSSSGGAVTAGRPLAGALQSALKMSEAVSGRTSPGGLNPNIPSFSTGPSGSFAGIVRGGFGAGGSGGGSNSFGGGRVSQSASDAPGTGTLVAGASAASASALSARWGENGSVSSQGLSGLPPGAWSGEARTSASYTPWHFSRLGDRDARVNLGGVDLTQGLGRGASFGALPTSLRFRYAGAPLWWSSGGSPSSGSSVDSGDDDLDGSSESRMSRPLRSALRAANSAASIWRSILVHPSRSGVGASGGGGSDSGGMDRGLEQSASSMSSLDSRLAVLAFGVGAGGAAGAAAGKGAESVYIAMDGAGRAGTVSGRARPDSLQMSIVAAVPPSPPSLESTASMSGSSGSTAHVEPRAKKHGHGGEQEGKSAEEGVSHSKIEGSVDAIAQRIYHRIRRRIASDRERFGG